MNQVLAALRFKYVLLPVVRQPKISFPLTMALCLRVGNLTRSVKPSSTLPKEIIRPCEQEQSLSLTSTRGHCEGQHRLIGTCSGTTSFLLLMELEYHLVSPSEFQQTAFFKNCKYTTHKLYKNCNFNILYVLIQEN